MVPLANGTIAFTAANLVVFSASEIGQDVLICPSRAAFVLHPLVIVLGVAACIDLCIDGTAAAQHAPLRVPHLAAAEVLLRHGAVAPIGSLTGELGKAYW